MPKSEYISTEQLGEIAKRAGIKLSKEEIELLKPVYEQYARGAESLHELDLGDIDLALTFKADQDSVPWNTSYDGR